MATLNRYSSAEATLLDDDREDGLEVEVKATVFYHARPAEPDVGIMNDYAETIDFAIQAPFLGFICFQPTEVYEGQLIDAANQRIDDGPYEDF